MRKTIIAAAAAVLLAVSVAASAAEAVKPAQHACVGETNSEGAKAAHPKGQFLQQFVHQGPGFGQWGIQELQRGNVGDDIVGNTCNDSSE